MASRLLPIIILISIYGPLCALAQAPQSSKRPIAAVRAAKPPVIDGDLTDEVWKLAPKADGFWDLSQNSLAPDQTTARILFDEKYIYVSFECIDSDPQSILARETVQDSKYKGRGFDQQDTEDNVEFALNTFRSGKFDDLNRFSVNAIGTISARIAGGRGGKAEWKGDWRAASKRTATGWTVEMQIPWSIMGYPNSEKPITMAVQFSRFQLRTKLRSVWSNTGLQEFPDLLGQWMGVSPPKGSFKPTLSLLPYMMPGMHRENPTLRTGIDARYTASPGLTVVSTLNPDFGTVEGAVEGIQFSRSERFLQEKRPFFQEGSDYFRAGSGFAIGQYFYAPHIDHVDFGTKVYGKLSPVDSVGFLNALDFGNRSDTILRYSHNFNLTSSAGFFVSQRSAFDDNNTVGMVDQKVRFGKFGIASQLAFSTGQSAGGGAKQMNLTYEDGNHFTSVQYLDVSPIFRNANGIVNYTDFRGIHIFDVYSMEWRRGFWSNADLSVSPIYDWHTDGKLFRRGADLTANFRTRSDWQINTEYYYQEFDGQVDNTYSLGLTYGASNRFKQLGFLVSSGRLASDPYFFVGPQFSFRLAKKLDVIYGGSVQHLAGRDQQHILTANYEISPTQSIGGRIVAQSASTNWYVSYRNSGEKGMETYFIIGDPNASRFSEQARLKLVFAL